MLLVTKKKIMRHVGEGGRRGDQKFLNPPQPLGTFLSLQYLASTGSPSANEGGAVERGRVLERGRVAFYFLE